MYQPSMDWVLEDDGFWINEWMDATVGSDENGFHWTLWSKAPWFYERPPEWDVVCSGTEASLGAAQQAAKAAFQLIEEQERRAEEDIERMVNEGG